MNGIEEHSGFAVPFGRPTQDVGGIRYLIDGDVLLEQSPHISEVWGGLDVEQEDIQICPFIAPIV